MMFKLKPFFYSGPYGDEVDQKRIRLVFAFGIYVGRRGAPEPSATFAVWFFRYRRIHRRTRGPNGALVEHWRISSHWLEFEWPGKRLRIQLEPPKRPRVELHPVGV